MNPTDAHAAMGLLADAQARSDADNEDARAVGWVVAVFDPATGFVEMFGPWPKAGAVDAAAWADRRVKRFTAEGDGGVALQTVVFPLFGRHERQGTGPSVA